MDPRNLVGKFIAWRTLRGNRSGVVRATSSDPECVVAHCGGRCEVNVRDIIRVGKSHG